MNLKLQPSTQNSGSLKLQKRQSETLVQLTPTPLGTTRNLDDIMEFPLDREMPTTTPKQVYKISHVGKFDKMNFHPQKHLQNSVTIDQIEENDFDDVMMKTATETLKWTFQESLVSLILITLSIILSLNINKLNKLTIHNILGIFLIIDTLFCFETLIFFIWKSNKLYSITVLTRRIPGWSRMPVAFEVRKHEKRSITSMSEVIGLPSYCIYIIHKYS